MYQCRKKNALARRAAFTEIIIKKLEYVWGTLFRSADYCSNQQSWVAHGMVHNRYFTCFFIYLFSFFFSSRFSFHTQAFNSFDKTIQSGSRIWAYEINGHFTLIHITERRRNCVDFLCELVFFMWLRRNYVHYYSHSHFVHSYLPTN